MTNETKSIIKLISRFLKNREFTILINKNEKINKNTLKIKYFKPDDEIPEDYIKGRPKPASKD